MPHLQPAEMLKITTKDLCIKSTIYFGILKASHVQRSELETHRLFYHPVNACRITTSPLPPLSRPHPISQSFEIFLRGLPRSVPTVNT